MKLLEIAPDKLAPICLFAFNRPDHTRQTLAALRDSPLAESSDLTVFVDGPRVPEEARLTGEVVDIVAEAKGFRSVKLIKQSTNQGLAKSVIDGVTMMLDEHEQVIVLEDDIVVSPPFLEFMNRSLATLKCSDQVASISGYSEPISNMPEAYFLRKGSSWGWATWRRVWNCVQWDGQALLSELEASGRLKDLEFEANSGFHKMLEDQVASKNNSWAIRFYVWCFLNQKLHLLPGRSLVQNIGHDGSGTHCGNSEFWKTEFVRAMAIDDLDLKLEEMPEVYQAHVRRFQDEFGVLGQRKPKLGLLRRVFSR
ncbi:glycosyltransferase family 2 protein [Ruegeria arenilitoris]|uniref:glycosyltransferase family 2 protein n=1 Tax=Ruegeria arenilitoris TaxID=1173585 RepID=UPI0014798DB3|nr:glycosyltransferase family 2 protein [Ruegeria arenilitoris]